MDAGAVKAMLEQHFTSADPIRSHEMYHDDAVLEFPQSGERFVGVDNLRQDRPRVDLCRRGLGATRVASRMAVRAIASTETILSIGHHLDPRARFVRPAGSGDTWR